MINESLRIPQSGLLVCVSDRIIPDKVFEQQFANHWN